ncbi:phosphatidylinositol diacylglycerol-lyase [Olivibacter ginsenosidimutans]|uniref:1-phosphatidylinositol phosphodiesterase n=1 Tax=Olivibacter ginsenosidimutans TaxID=1176537 RepID=A0ABP9AFL0_9SPHI
MKTFIYVISILTAIFMCSSCRKENELLSAQKTTTSNANVMSTAVTIHMENAADWMSYLPDTVSINQLSIPGTHDSGARHEPIGGTAKTQNLSIADQLTAGVRFLDIRCRHYQGAFVIHHGSIYQQLNFDDVLLACKTFLQQHPSETIVMSVKEEYNAEGNTKTFAEEFDRYVEQDPSFWYLEAGIPILGETRGKIVLFRRFSAPEAKGIDASHDWADKATFTITNQNYTLRIQDQYEVSNNDTKFQAVTDLFEEALQGNQDDQTLFVNFTSGYRNVFLGIPNIPDVANAINPKLSAYFDNAIAGRYGIVPMDFVNDEFAWKIIQKNF